VRLHPLDVGGHHLLLALARSESAAAGAAA
jgi:hypothetical protein